jgi:hypothetical protein
MEPTPSLGSAAGDVDLNLTKLVAVVIIATLLVIDGLEFHDLLEPKTVPEVLTGLISVPILVLMGTELHGGRRGR